MSFEEFKNAIDRKMKAEEALDEEPLEAVEQVRKKLKDLISECSPELLLRFNDAIDKTHARWVKEPIGGKTKPKRQR